LVKQHSIIIVVVVVILLSKCCQNTAKAEKNEYTYKKNVSYRKQIAHQHLYHTKSGRDWGVVEPEKSSGDVNFLIHVATKFCCCVSCRVGACKRS